MNISAYVEERIELGVLLCLCGSTNSVRREGGSTHGMILMVMLIMSTVMIILTTMPMTLTMMATMMVMLIGNQWLAGSYQPGHRPLSSAGMERGDGKEHNEDEDRDGVQNDGDNDNDGGDDDGDVGNDEDWQSVVGGLWDFCGREDKGQNQVEKNKI